MRYNWKINCKSKNSVHYIVASWGMLILYWRSKRPGGVNYYIRFHRSDQYSSRHRIEDEDSCAAIRMIIEMGGELPPILELVRKEAPNWAESKTKHYICACLNELLR